MVAENTLSLRNNSQAQAFPDCLIIFLIHFQHTMSHTKILLAEDDKKLGMILKAYFDANDFPTTLCMNGEEAWNRFLSSEYDICIFDVPADGFTIIEQIKKTNPMIPVLVLSSNMDQENVLNGFQSGIEDYITKPFSMDELLARVKVWSRWSSYMQVTSQPSIYHLGSFTFDAPRHLLTNDQETKKLTSKEADLLLMLCEHVGDTLERSSALKQIWKEESSLNARSMDVYITKLRKHFKDDPNVDIQNVHGVGFKLVVK